MELYQTELTYVNNLKLVLKAYHEPLLTCCESLGISKDNINKIFGIAYYSFAFVFK